MSIYFPADTGPITEHALAVETSFVAPGNATAEPTLPGATKLDVRPVLSAVDVRRPDAVAVVTLGDSITDGQHSTVDADGLSRTGASSRSRRHSVLSDYKLFIDRTAARNRLATIPFPCGLAENQRSEEFS